MGMYMEYYEKMTVKNTNSKAADVMKGAQNYLKQVKGAAVFIMDVDGKQYVLPDDLKYDSDEEKYLTENPDMKAILDHLTEAKSMSYILYANDGDWDLREKNILCLLTDDSDLKATVTYRSLAIFSDDSTMDLYCFDENGVSDFTKRYSHDMTDVQDVREWYADTPDLLLTYREEDEDNENLRCQIMEHMRKIVPLMSYDENLTNDEIDTYIEEEDDSIYLSTSFFFNTEDIPMILAELQKLQQLAGDNNMEMQLQINAIPDDDAIDKGIFEAVSFLSDGNQVEARFYKF